MIEIGWENFIGRLRESFSPGKFVTDEYKIVYNFIFIFPTGLDNHLKYKRYFEKHRTLYAIYVSIQFEIGHNLGTGI